MLIRAASPDDAVAIEEIRVAAWRMAFRSHMPAAFLDSLDPGSKVVDLQQTLRAQVWPFSVKVAEIEGRVVAWAVVGNPRYASESGTLELWALNVAPSQWRRGAGRRLVEEAIASARTQRFERLELWCLVGNEQAVALYESCGFGPTGDTRTTSRLTGHPLHEAAFRYLT